MRDRPRLGDIRRGLSERLSGARYLLEDALYALSRIPVAIWRTLRAIGGSLGSLWAGLEVYTRRRLTAVTGVLALAAILWLVIVPVAPCEFPGGDRCPPADEAEDLVPAGALAYLHVNVDPDSEQGELARDLGAKLPTLGGELGELTDRVPGLGLELGGWFEGEIASALLAPAPGSRAARSVVLLETGDERAARGFAREFVGADPERSERRGVAIEAGRGQAAALAGGFLVTGDRSAVERVIDTGAGETPSLADDSDAARLRDRLPDSRLGDGYVSRFGAQRLLQPGAGPLALLEPFVNPAATTAAAAALSLSDSGVELSVLSEQDPERAKQRPGFFGAFESFDPELPEHLAGGTFAYLGVGRPAEGARELIGAASAGAPELAAGLRAVAEDLERQGRISLVDQVLPLLGDEASISVGPRSREGLGAVPYLELLTRGVDEDQAERDMARLQGPIARAVQAEPGGSFEEIDAGDGVALSLRVSPTLDLTYAILDGLLLVATQPEALTALDAEDTLADSEEFREATSDLGGSPAALLFADLEGLIGLGEQAGLAEDPAYAVFAEDLRRLGALGLVVSRDGDVLATNARLLID